MKRDEPNITRRDHRLVSITISNSDDSLLILLARRIRNLRDSQY